GLLGVRGRPDPRPAAQLELPGRGRRRHRPRHVLPLELRARAPVRWRRGRDDQGRHPHPAALGREGPPLPGHRRRRGLRDLRAARRRHRPDQLLVGGAGGPQGAGGVPGGRHARLGGRGPVRLPRAAPRPHPDAGVEPGPADRAGLPRAVGGGPRQPGVHQRLPRAVGAVPARRRGGPPAPLRLRKRRARAAAGRGGAALQRRGRAGRAARGGPMTAVDTSIELPAAGGGWRTVELAAPRRWEPHPGPDRSRVAFAAAHVVGAPWGETVPGAPAVVDWDSTLEFRRHLFSYGLGVAEAMDTAQRNMGLDWPAVRELVRRSAEQAHEHGARIAAGAGTDHRAELATADDVLAAYTEQVEHVEGTGAQVILMASRQLAAVAAGPDDYLRVYSELLRQVREPVILHWLGEAFDPQL